jgi:hypothetical protein
VRLYGKKVLTIDHRDYTINGPTDAKEKGPPGKSATAIQISGASANESGMTANGMRRRQGGGPKVNNRLQVAALCLFVALGFWLRVRGLNRVGFNKKDEVHKVEAARGYLRGNFSLNLEHPMLMKSLIAVSLAATDSWKLRAGESRMR